MIPVIPIIIHYTAIGITLFFGYKCINKCLTPIIQDEIVIGNVTQNFIPKVKIQPFCHHRYMF